LDYRFAGLVMFDAGFGSILRWIGEEQDILATVMLVFIFP
jgi:hypothetical protein